MKEHLECERCGWKGTPYDLEWITDDLGGLCPDCGESEENMLLHDE